MSKDNPTELRRERAALHEKAKALLETAKRERRDLTAGEEARFDRIHEDIEKRTVEIEEIESGLRARGIATGPGRHAPPEPDDYLPVEIGAEIRALRPDESCADYVRSRGLGGGAEEVNLGKYLAALYRGPQDDAERRALAEGTDAAGGFTVPSILSGELIDRMRPQSHVIRAGAQIVPLESDDHSFARVKTDPVPAWRLENASVDESDPAFDRVRFVPKSVAFLVRASRELLQDSVNLEDALPALFSRVMAAELDRVALFGAAANDEPVGVRNATGITEISQGANGAALADYAPFLAIRRAILEANGPVPTDTIFAPRTGEQLFGLTASDGQPLDAPGPLTSMRWRETSKVAVDETQGTSEDASTAFTGGFGHLWIGQRLAVQIQPLRERYADANQIGWLVAARWDVQFDQPAAIGRIVGITAT